MRDADAADWLSVAEARERILNSVGPLAAEEVPLGRAGGRILAEDIVSPVDLPPWDNSAMDGFAVRSADVRGATAELPRTLRVVDDIPAGAFPSLPIGSGEAARIMTGAPVPEGADGVIRVEHTQAADTTVSILTDGDAGRNVRPRGGDVAAGDVVLRAGTRLGAAQSGLAAAVGRERLRVVRRPWVAVLASGDELVELDRFDEVLEGRRIVSSNSYSLAAALAEDGMLVRALGIAADDPAELRVRLEAAIGCDALITSAGVSVGEHDYLRSVLTEMGAELLFWRVRARPGSALACGRVPALGGVPWFGLPGNPVSTLVAYEVFVRPALLRMAGHGDVFRPTVTAAVGEACRASPAATHFLRARLERRGDDWRVIPFAAQSSAILSGMAAADALLVVPEGCGGWTAGERAPAVVLGGWPPAAEPGY